MPHQEKSIFSWHTYTDHLRDMLKEMMTSNDFADVTLVCDDKKDIKAHRNILSACSPVFKNMLKIDQQSNHPVIYLRGIQHLQMEAILKFVYLGETSIHQDILTEFIQTAKLLEIREFDKSRINTKNSRLTGLKMLATNVKEKRNAESLEQKEKRLSAQKRQR